MGFFKSIRALQQQAAEIEQTMPPPGQRARDATARMASMTQMMAQQTQAANATLGGAAVGPDVMVTITDMRQVGILNFDLMMQFDATVMPDGRPPYPATFTQTITQMQLVGLRAGATLPGRASAEDPSAIWLDFSSLQ
jgi:hypothetical protein